MTYVTILNRERVLETGLETLKHLCIVTIVTNVVQDVLVRDNVERSEHYNDWNVVANIRQRRLDRLSTLNDRVR